MGRENTLGTSPMDAAPPSLRVPRPPPPSPPLAQTPLPPRRGRAQPLHEHKLCWGGFPVEGVHGHFKLRNSFLKVPTGQQPATMPCELNVELSHFWGGQRSRGWLGTPWECCQPLPKPGGGMGPFGSSPFPLRTTPPPPSPSQAAPSEGRTHSASSALRGLLRWREDGCGSLSEAGWPPRGPATWGLRSKGAWLHPVISKSR